VTTQRFQEQLQPAAQAEQTWPCNAHRNHDVMTASPEHAVADRKSDATSRNLAGRGGGDAIGEVPGPELVPDVVAGGLVLFALWVYFALKILLLI
jgi:hypothetical protein